MLNVNLVKEIRTVIPKGIKYIRIEGLKHSIRNGTKLANEDLTQDTLNTLGNLGYIDKKGIKYNELFWVTYTRPGEVVPKVFARPISEKEIEVAKKKDGITIVSTALFVDKTLNKTPFDE